MIRYERDEDGLVAASRVRVGMGEVELRVPLGPWAGPDPPPDGLAGRPVVAVAEGRAAELAAAGARRSGRREADVLPVAGHRGALLRSTAEVLVLPELSGALLAAIRALGGRPLPAIPFDDAGAVERLFRECPVDVDGVVPAIEPARTRAREVALGLGLDAMHHLVEVDPRPAYAELGRPIDDASLAELAAAATGVLAGRVAAGNRRWRGGA